MQGIDRIVGRIREEAASDVDKIEKDARAQALQILQRARVNADAAYEQRLQDTERTAEEIKRRAKSTAKLAAQKTALSTKQELIGEVFDRVLDNLKKLPDAQRVKLLAGLLERYAQGGETVFYAKADTDLMETVLRETNRALTGRKCAALIDGGADDHISGGVLLRAGNVETNLTLEALVRKSRPHLTGEVAGMLF